MPAPFLVIENWILSTAPPLEGEANPSLGDPLGSLHEPTQVLENKDSPFTQTTFVMFAHVTQATLGPSYYVEEFPMSCSLPFDP